jgi:hypothetical protein
MSPTRPKSSWLGSAKATVFASGAGDDRRVVPLAGPRARREDLRRRQRQGDQPRVLHRLREPARLVSQRHRGDHRHHGRTRFGFLFVENEAPYLDRYAEADEAFRWAAQQMNDRGAAIFARCLKAGEWPGYQPFTASPPAWWLNDLTTTEYQEAA